MASNTINAGIEYHLTATGEGKVRSAFASVARSIAPAITAAVALRGAVKLAGEAYKQAVEGHKAMATMTAVLNSTGKAAQFSADGLADMADKMQWVSDFGDEDIMSEAITSLLRFDVINKDTLPRALQLTMDMAAKTKDLAGASRLLGVSLDNPILGMTRLLKAGNSLSESQKQMIKQFVETGEKAKAQEILLRALESRYAGQAKAQMTAAGQMKKAWEEYLQYVGEQTQPYLDGALNAVTQFMNSVLAAGRSTSTQAESDVLTVLNNVSRGIYDFMSGFDFLVKFLWHTIQAPFRLLEGIFMTTINSFLLAVKKVFSVFTKIPVGIFKSIFQFDPGPLLKSFDEVGKAGTNNITAISAKWKSFGDYLGGFGGHIDELKKRLDTWTPTQFVPIKPFVIDDGGGAGAAGEGQDTVATEAAIARADKLKKLVLGIYQRADEARGVLRKVWDDLKAGQERYYADVTFADKKYYDYKKTQIENEARLAMFNGSITASQYKLWVDQRIAALDKEKKAYEENIAGQSEALKKIEEQQLSLKDVMTEVVSLTGQGFSRMVTEGKNFAETMKNIWKSWVGFAMQELNKLIAKLVVANIIKLATGLGTGGTATVGESLALVATNLMPGIGGGPTITSIGSGGGTGNDNWQPPNNGTLSIVNELRQLRRDVYAAQPSAVQLNIRKGELSYAVDRDRKYRMVL
jgi:hypothetical protein